MSNATDLLGDAVPEPLPTGKRLRYLEDLIGHTILAVFEGTRACKGTDVVIVTETKCWLTAQAEDDGDSKYISVSNHGFGDPSLSDYVKAKDLFEAGCINSGEFEVLRKAEQEQEATERKRQKNLLRQRLAALENTN